MSAPAYGQLAPLLPDGTRLIRWTPLSAADLRADALLLGRAASNRLHTSVAAGLLWGAAFAGPVVAALLGGTGRISVPSTGLFVVLSMLLAVARTHLVLGQQRWRTALLDRLALRDAILDGQSRPLAGEDRERSLDVYLALLRGEGVPSGPYFARLLPAADGSARLETVTAPLRLSGAAPAR